MGMACSGGAMPGGVALRLGCQFVVLMGTRGAPSQSFLYASNLLPPPFAIQGFRICKSSSTNHTFIHESLLMLRRDSFQTCVLPMNIPSILVLILIAVIAVMAVRHLKKKQGKCGPGGCRECKNQRKCDDFH